MGTNKEARAYDYLDEGETLLFEVARIQKGADKTFFQRRPDGKGGWIKQLGDTRRVLYRLPQLKDAGLVCVPEGERDIQALEQLGRVATCNPRGACKWRDE